MDFTREPVIQTVITPREGCKLVVRSSRGTSQEEYFVDAVEIVSFGTALFFRSLEKPKSFLLPVTEYEVLEVREARLVLKHVGVDRSIKIGGGREAALRPPREAAEKTEPQEVAESEEPATADGKVDKKREKRRHGRRRRGAQEEKEPGVVKEPSLVATTEEEKISIPEPGAVGLVKESIESAETGATVLRSLFPPPPTLISETIARYREDALFKDAFYSREEKEEHGSVVNEEPDKPSIPPEKHHGEEETEDPWNFSRELSNNKNE